MPKKSSKEYQIKISPTKGRPMLNWVGKKPLDYVKGYPAVLMEVFDPLKTNLEYDVPRYENLEKNWQNLLFYGDNKDVLATLLEQGFRGKIDLIYIDPPFMSGADYVRRVELRGLKETKTDVDDADLLQQTMYFDMWRNDAYLQFMYERLILLKELLAETGSIYVHLDWHVGHYVKLLMDEIFGQENFRNEIVVNRIKKSDPNIKRFNVATDMILFYSKTPDIKFNLVSAKKLEKDYWHALDAPGQGEPRIFWNKKIFPPRGRHWMWNQDEIDKSIQEKRLRLNPKTQKPEYLIEKGREQYVDSNWTDVSAYSFTQNFATEKNEALVERIIKASSNSDDLVLDCFIGSGTTAAVVQKLGRRWIGCDINKGAIQTTSKRIQKIILEQIKSKQTQYHSFATYKVNNYDLQLLRTEAIELAVQHIGIQRTKTDSFFDGTLAKKLVKIIDFNHPFTLLDFQLIQDELKKRPNEDRNITVVCLGKELAIDPVVEEWNKKHPVNKIEVIELKTDKKYGNFLIHKPDEAKVKIKRKENKAVIEILDFISPTIIERLNIDNTLFKVKIPDFRSMIDCVLVDTNYDGKTFHIVYSDVPEKKNDLIKGKYELEIFPLDSKYLTGQAKNKTTVAVKIIDMLGEEIIITEKI